MHGTIGLMGTANPYNVRQPRAKQSTLIPLYP